MADGTQFDFGFREMPVSRLRPGEIVVDLFAGGGGASTALEQALGRPVDIAINHNPIALAMHAANHPLTLHLAEDIWEANPRHLCAGRSIGWLHASPDCRHFSQAKGGQPRSRATRSLSWVVLRWAATARPRIISLENVHQILQWGPLRASRDAQTGRIYTLDLVIDPATGRKVHRVAAPGERVPINNQFLVPDKRHAGRTWDHFVGLLRGMGYVVEWRRIKACDHGAGTSRDRLFLVARCDGEPISWPKPTHGPGRAHPFVTAADCIDWSIDAPSIFSRKKPLADATCRRITRGIKRFVIDAAQPFIVPATHQGGDRCNNGSDPLPTITAANRGELMAVSPIVVQCANASANGVATGAQPLGVVTAQPKGGSHAVVTPMLVQAGHGEGSGATARRSYGINDVQQPLGTVVASNGGHYVAAATLIQTGYSERPGQAPRVPGIDKPVGTLVNGKKHAVVIGHLTAMAQNVPGVVTAFLDQANGGGPNGNPASARAADQPVSAITGTGSQQRLVTANIVTMRKNAIGDAVTDPLGTVTAGAIHHAVVEYTLSPEQEAGALRVAAFLIKYYGTGQATDLREPVDTITTRDRLALVTVTIKGTPYVIVDIGLRMLKPHELYRAQGFPNDYIHDRTADGRRLTITQSVAMVGNSVSPPPLRAIAEANLDRVQKMAEAA